MKGLKFTRATVSSILILLAASCIDPYPPPASNSEITFLVVDGFFDSGSRSANVKISRAVPLDAASTNQPVRSASVQLEGPNGLIVPLPEATPGVYSRASVNIATGQRVQLRVKVAGKEYLSDPVELKAAPILDSVTWKPERNGRGVQVYVDSHDVTGSTKYYIWTFTETWEYNADNFSPYIWQNGQVRDRRPDEYLYTCYGQNISTRVLISSTTGNALDVVADFPLAFIPKASRKVSRLYSILVQQRAMDEQAYTFWKNIQKSTENLGGLFDPLPTEITGNMHNVNDADEKVLGYFAGGEVQQKRLYISHSELPEDLKVVERFQCLVDSISVAELPRYAKTQLFLIGAWLGGEPPSPVGYISAPENCIDCRKLGGVLQKPSYWPR